MLSPAAHHSSPTHDKPQAIKVTAGGLLFLLLCAVRRRLVHGDIMFLQDAHVYSRAFNRFSHGLDPYAKDILYFVYAPIFLNTESLLSHVFSHRGAWMAYLVPLVIATLSVPILLSYWLDVDWLSSAVCLVLFAFQPYLIAEQILLTGNLSAILYAAGLATGLLGLRKNRWLPFYAVVVVASLVKPPFLAMLLIPLFCSKRQLLPTFASAALTAVGYLCQQIWEPSLYAGFRHAATAQILERDDLGYGVVRLLHHIHRLPLTLAVCVHLLLITALLSLLWNVRTLRHSTHGGKIWLATLIVLVIAANPRFKEYDICIAFLPALYLLIESIRFFFKDDHSRAPIVVSIVFLVALLTLQDGLSWFLLIFGPILAGLYMMRRMQPGIAVHLPAPAPG